MITIEIKDNIKNHKLTIHMVRKQETQIEEYYGGKLSKYIDAITQQYIDKLIKKGVIKQWILEKLFN